MSAVAARGLDSDTPIRKSRVRIVGLQHVCKIHDRLLSRSERIHQFFYIGDSPDQKRHVNLRFGMLPSDMTEVPIAMKEVVLHVDDDQGRVTYVWTYAGHLHQRLPLERNCSALP